MPRVAELGTSEDAGAEFGVALGEGSFYEMGGIYHGNSKFLRGRLLS